MKNKLCCVLGVAALKLVLLMKRLMRLGRSLRWINLEHEEERMHRFRDVVRQHHGSRTGNSFCSLHMLPQARAYQTLTPPYPKGGA
jgi:hypothetical protein